MWTRFKFGRVVGSAGAGGVNEGNRAGPGGIGGIPAAWLAPSPPGKRHTLFPDGHPFLAEIAPVFLILLIVRGGEFRMVTDRSVSKMAQPPRWVAECFFTS
jgi:hypothetical protein